MKFMIERRYGRCNRDWLLAIDNDTTWILGAHRALPLDTKEEADEVLAKVKALAAKWEIGGVPCTGFTFEIIEDRRHLPSYWGSKVAA